MKSLIIIWVAVLLSGAALFSFADYATAPAHVYADVSTDTNVGTSDKYDGECTGHETVGRCADKCSDGQLPTGFDKQTGIAICNALQDPQNHQDQIQTPDTIPAPISGELLK